MTYVEPSNIYYHIQPVIYTNNFTVHPHRLHPLSGSALAPQHLLRVYQHHLALWRPIRPSSMHHHHNDLMKTTTPSELKIQGIISSQTQRQAELTSRSSQCLMQWPSAVEHLVNSIFGSKQPSLGGRSIKYVHLCKSAESTSSSTGKESSDPCVDILEVDDYIYEETSVDSHQEEGSSLIEVIRSQRRVEFHLRAEEHQSVIVLDYIFLTNPHHAHHITSGECSHDIARRVSSNIKQQESSSGDPSHLRVISLGIIVEHIKALFVTGDGHLVLVFINGMVILLHCHQVWPVHAVYLQAFHLCLHLLWVHLSFLSVLAIPPLHLLEDRDRPSQPQRAHHCRMFSFILHISTHLLQVHPRYHLQQQHLPHLEPHQFVHHDLEAERGNDIMNDIINDIMNDIMVIIFKFEMNIIEEKDICPYVHQHPFFRYPSVLSTSTSLNSSSSTSSSLRSTSITSLKRTSTLDNIRRFHTFFNHPSAPSTSTSLTTSTLLTTSISASVEYPKTII